MLKRLEDKGYVQPDRLRNAAISTAPRYPKPPAKKSALSEIVRVSSTVRPRTPHSALLGMSDRLQEDELNQLEQMIARARKAKGSK